MSLDKMFSTMYLYSFCFKSSPDRLKCTICVSILIDASQTSCGCKVCNKCIRNYLSSGPKPCPGNQLDCAHELTLDDINRDNATNKEISNLKVECPFEECSFSAPLKNMILSHMDECELRELVCDKCRKRIKTKDIESHHRESCSMRMEICKYCKIEMIYKDLIDVHLNYDSNELCPKYVSICPNNCGIKSKVNLKTHLPVCSNRKVDCPFGSLKCDVKKLSKENLTVHLQEENVAHIISLLDKIKQLESEIENMKIKFENREEDIKNLKETIKITSSSYLNAERKIQELKAKSPMNYAVSQSTIFRNASFIWKISNFESKRTDSEIGVRLSITSDPFYTSDFGYKMCLRIYPGGDGVGRGNHLSVFFAIMKGEYDDLLSWPFKHKVTLSLLDQEANAKPFSDTFKPDSRSICYQKPVDEYNIASGSPKFIMFSTLMNNSPYYKNDTIYLKISVDTLGIMKP